MQAAAERIGTVRVELEIGGTPPSGVVIRAGAPAQPFWGWLELMQILQDMTCEEPRKSEVQPQVGRVRDPSTRREA